MSSVVVVKGKSENGFILNDRQELNQCFLHIINVLNTISKFSQQILHPIKQLSHVERLDVNRGKKKTKQKNKKKTNKTKTEV